MNEKIEKFKSMSLAEQKKIILIVMSNSIDKSEWIKKLYEVVQSVNIDIELAVIKNEFIKIYTFLMEAVNYIKSQELKDSMWKLSTINDTINQMREKERKERDEENLEIFFNEELNNL